MMKPEISTPSVFATLKTELPLLTTVTPLPCKIALLPTVMAYNAPCTGEKYRDIADAFGVEGAYTMPLEEAREAAGGLPRHHRRKDG